ncbi:MAG TPA: SMC-Scp complex subunit ScpB [Anaerolineaceae bacterium]|jgi:segregation and condensation protein B
MTDLSESRNDPDLFARIEALLFVASGPVTITSLANALDIPAGDVEGALNAMDEVFSQGGGLCLQWQAGRVQMTTAPRMGGLVERFLGLEATSRLSRAGLEALAIIAYQQPVTRPQLDSIRAVNSDSVMKSLLSKGLIQEVGRAEGPGRPILYATTSDFLQYFGLKSLVEIPSLESYAAQITPEPKEILKE